MFNRCKWPTWATLVVFGAILAIVMMGCAAGGSAAYPGVAYADYAEGSAASSAYAPEPLAESTRSRSSDRRGQTRSDDRLVERAQSTGGVAADGEGSDPGSAQRAQPEEKKTTRPLLIYTGTLIVALYDVAGTQERAIQIVEQADGFVAHRTNDRLVLRVPAEDFRTILEELAGLGDLLDMTWQAQDVTEEVRDLSIRLQNNLEMRRRLEQLLEKAENVEEALAIEAQLERITLEMERIVGQLRSFEDRIAYSTITMTFRAKRPDEIPDDEYLLPFSFLNRLGVEQLMRIPEVR